MKNNKRLLIISPHFAPANTADMQRIRMSLPYFANFGWEVEVISVRASYDDVVKDDLLLKSIPSGISVHQTKALSKKWTSKLGLGSLALRSLLFFKRKGNHLLKEKEFDLIYFSTTEFPVCILGSYWKKKFGIPYVIDMQDPWHSDYYKNKPKNERPKKYWFSYRLHKYLEPIAMKDVGGLISVSNSYIENLYQRYPTLEQRPSATITFGAFDLDLKIAQQNTHLFKTTVAKKNDELNLVYVGRGGFDMHNAIETLFNGFKHGLKYDHSLFSTVKMHFIGTSYAPSGKGVATIKPIAEAMDIGEYVIEYTDRIGFYESLNNLNNADGLIIIGSNEAAYTASKIYPYILCSKPLLAVLHPESSASHIINECKAGDLINIGETVMETYFKLKNYMENIQAGTQPHTNWEIFEQYTARHLTGKQVELFNEVLAQEIK